MTSEVNDLLFDSLFGHKYANVGFWTLQLNNCVFFHHFGVIWKDKTGRYHTIYHKVRISSNKVQILGEKTHFLSFLDIFWSKMSISELKFQPDNIDYFISYVFRQTAYRSKSKIWWKNYTVSFLNFCTGYIYVKFDENWLFNPFLVKNQCFLHFLHTQSIILYDFDVISKIKSSLTVRCKYDVKMWFFVLILGHKPLFGVKIDILGKKSVFLFFPHNQRIVL